MITYVFKAEIDMLSMVLDDLCCGNPSFDQIHLQALFSQR